MRRILVADDHEITGADFDLQEILSAASELKDIPRGREWFRVAIERIRNNSHRPGLDVHGEAAPAVFRRQKGILIHSKTSGHVLAGAKKIQSALVTASGVGSFPRRPL